jgi:hypothetical protein
MSRVTATTGLDVLIGGQSLMAAAHVKDTFSLLRAALDPHDDVVTGLRRARIDRVAEFWCHAPGEILAKRYTERVDSRHPSHPDASYAPELALLARVRLPWR